MHAVEPELRREFSLIEPLRGKDLDVAKRISEANNPISLHFRRGDYVSFFGRHMLVSNRYYERAINHLLKQDRKMAPSSCSRTMWHLLESGRRETQDLSSLITTMRRAATKTCA